MVSRLAIYAELVQEFPASESHHHAYPGGMLDHGLEIVAYALKLRQSYLLPIGSSPEEQSAQSEVWTAGIAYAALLHDIGKIAVDLHVEYENGTTWHPWHGIVKQPYRFKYLKEREYRLHNASTGLVYHQILSTAILDWLSQAPDLWSVLIYHLSGQHEHAGVLGEIVTKADQASVAQELGGDPAKAMQAPKHALQRKLLDGLRYLVKEELKLNNSGPSDGWLTDDALWLVSKTVSDKLRAHLLSSGVSGIPEKNSAIFDVLQEHAIIQATPDDKAIWTATVKSDSGWNNTFTFLKVSPALIWDNQRPESFIGTVLPSAEKSITKIVEEASIETSDNSSIMQADTVKEVLADSLDAVISLLHQPADIGKLHIAYEATKPIEENIEEPSIQVVDSVKAETSKVSVNNSEDILSLGSGEHFLQWLKEAILRQKLTVNEPQALVHTIDETIYIVTPGIFMRYVHEFPEVQHANKDSIDSVTTWRWVQKNFEKLKIHKKQSGGLNIWSCNVSGPRNNKKIHGYLLLNPEEILPDKIMFNNPYLCMQ